MSAPQQRLDLENVVVIAPGQTRPTLQGVGFSLVAGDALGVIGPSGSGKTTIALALLGYARRGCRLSGGVVQVGEHNMLALSEQQLQLVQAQSDWVIYSLQLAALTGGLDALVALNTEEL